MPGARTKPRSSSSYTCDNQAQVNSQSSPGGVPRLFEHLLEVIERMSQRISTVLKALGGQEGSDLDLSCSAGQRTRSGGKAGVDRHRAAHAADGRQADAHHLAQVRIEPKMVASAQPGRRSRHLQELRRHGCAVECCS